MPQHEPLVLDVPPGWLQIRSSTPGHHHLYLGRPMSTEQESSLLAHLAERGILQPGFVERCRGQGFSAVRPPWVTKPAHRPPLLIRWGRRPPQLADPHLESHVARRRLARSTALCQRLGTDYEVEEIWGQDDPRVVVSTTAGLRRANLVSSLDRFDEDVRWPVLDLDRPVRIRTVAPPTTIPLNT